MNGQRPVVVIVGAGFGGLNAARALKHAPVDVILIDRHNYHLFQPLLYQVATAGISDTDIAYPVRAVFRNQSNLTFRMTEMMGADLEKDILHTTTGPIEYDYLILAPGGEPSYFGLDSVKENAFALNDLADAVAIRNHILRMFELASQTRDPELKKALRTFVIVGAGPTGVESAGAISELIRLVLRKDYPDLAFSDVRVLLLEMLDQVLPAFPEKLGREARRMLLDKYVEVRLNAKVADFDGKVVTMDSGEEIPALTMVWAAGVQASSVLGKLGLERTKKGRVKVEPTLQLPGYPNVYVIGDAASLEEEGEELPMLAQVAIQQGKTAARNIRRSLAWRPERDFHYRDLGMMATIGRGKAVSRVGKNIEVSGLPAWLAWLAIHIFWLIGFRNRLLVLINWASNYIFFERGVRIVSPPVDPKRDRPPFAPEPQLLKVWETAGEDAGSPGLRQSDS